MKSKLSGILAALLAATMLMTACSGDDSGSESASGSSSAADDSQTKTAAAQEETEPSEEVSMEADADAVPVSGAAPVLSISDAEGAPGDIVPVTISISGAEDKWSMCGVHVVYDDRLVCLEDENAGQEYIPVYEKGEAVKYAEAFTSMLQTGEKRNDYLIENNQCAVFFASVSSIDNGKDGDIITYQFQIPEDAQPGTVYELGFYYRQGDMFLDAAQDMAIQDYAFSHWQGAAVTVK